MGLQKRRRGRTGLENMSLRIMERGEKDYDNDKEVEEMEKKAGRDEDEGEEYEEN
jgi:hypothetical protein